MPPPHFPVFPHSPISSFNKRALEKTNMWENWKETHMSFNFKSNIFIVELLNSRFPASYSWWRGENTDRFSELTELKDYLDS